MRKGCIPKALIVFGFVMILYGTVRVSYPTETLGENVYPKEAAESSEYAYMETAAAGTEEAAEEVRTFTDLSEAFDVILNGATKNFIAGYAVDEAFLIWLDAQYGDELILELAYCVLDGNMDPDIWYEKTGNSMHVLWLRFCQDSGFQSYRLSDVYWMDTADPKQAVFAFTGDFNFAEDWHTMKYMEQQEDGLAACFSEELLAQMRAADVLLMNNEFTYVDEGRGATLPGKAYSFRAKPEMTEMLSVFGADAVTLANNHVYDYGETGLLDTMRHLDEAGIPYLGAGENRKEASKILYYVVNGRKVAIVSATQIERTAKYTKEATETEAGVLKTLRPELFLRVIREAEANSDYVIAVVHWGSEGIIREEESQRMLAAKFAEAGADAIIGGHPHRLQGAGFVNGVPVAYSLGNFWFSNGTLYTTVAQVVISEDGTLTLQFVPCIQKNMVTSLITDPDEKEAFYHYLAAVSSEVGLDAAGNVYDKRAEGYPAARVVYDSDTSRTDIKDWMDNEGNAIDIVGNLK